MSAEGKGRRVKDRDTERSITQQSDHAVQEGESVILS